MEDRTNDRRSFLKVMAVGSAAVAGAAAGMLGTPGVTPVRRRLKRPRAGRALQDGVH